MNGRIFFWSLTSALAADNLQKMGYTNVISMDGGIRDWREKGYPLEADLGSRLASDLGRRTSANQTGRRV